MRKPHLFFWGALLLIITVAAGCSPGGKTSVVSGPYLGQSPPGMTPEIFAPGIVSTGYWEIKAVFSPDGRELYYQLWGEPFPVIILMTERDGRWTEPEVAPFSGQIIEGYNISPDGKRMFVTSRRPLKSGEEPSDSWRVWVTEKTASGWGDLNVLPPTLTGYPSVAANGNLYLATGDIWVSEFVDGEYTEMRKLGEAINTEEYAEEDLFIAPNESYLMFCRRGDGFGSWDIFISFRREDGSWTEAQNMGGEVNTSASEVYPVVTPDGEYFFFSSSRAIHEDFSATPITLEEKLRILNGPGNGQADIYWVDARIIEELYAEIEELKKK